MTDTGRLNQRAIDAIKSLIEDENLTDVEVIERSGVPRNTFYRKMRGETPLNTDDLDKIAHALGVDALELLSVGGKSQDYDLVANDSINEDRGETDADYDNA